MLPKLLVSAIKKKETLIYVTTWMILENMLSESRHKGHMS